MSAADGNEKGRRYWIDWLDAACKIVGAIAICFAVLQYYESQRSERRRVAIEVVAHAKDRDVVEALVRLEKHYARANLNYAEIELDVARVMSWYDHLAMLYVYDRVANRCIIKGAVTPYATFVQRVLDELKYPLERRAHFDLLVNLMPNERCEPGSASTS